jgi:hypothetical protein
MEQAPVRAGVTHAAASAGAVGVPGLAVPGLAVPGLGQPAARADRRPGRAGDLRP